MSENNIEKDERYKKMTAIEILQFYNKIYMDNKDKGVDSQLVYEQDTFDRIVKSAGLNQNSIDLMRKPWIYDIESLKKAGIDPDQEFEIDTFKMLDKWNNK